MTSLRSPDPAPRNVVQHVLFAAAVIAAAWTLARLEIEIEGNEGWAASLPTWRIQNRWTRWFFGGRPLTGYHLYVHLWVVTMVHLPLLLGFAEPSWSAEARILSFLIVFWVLEDFLWFVLNPAFGIRRFTPQHAWWHAAGWWWIAPREYWLFMPVAAALYAFAA